MTPALKAMVDAMAAEIVRQTDDQIWRGDDPKFVHIGIYAAQYGNGENNGQIDLEKVARAGLEVIGAASELQALAMSRAFREWDGTGGELRAYQEIWAAGVAHTLGLLRD